MKQRLPSPLLCAFLSLALTLLTQCGNSNPLDFNSLMEQQPFVTDIEPPEGSVLKDPVSIKLKFSERIHLGDIQPISIAFLQIPTDPELRTNPAKLVEEIQEQALPQIKINKVLEGNETELTLIPDTPLDPGLYYLVVTPQLKSIHGIPFNQNPGKTPSPFVAIFGYGSQWDTSVSLEDSMNDSPSFGPPPDQLVLNEILYDGIESDSNGESFIELWGTPDSDISGYEIQLLNGANGEETDKIVLPEDSWISGDGIFVIADLKSHSSSESGVQNYDFLDQFDPQNGPDAVFLFNRNGEILDRLQYGSGEVAITPSGEKLAENLPAEDAGAGQSLSRVQGVDTQDNSQDFIILSVPSPGIL